ncbi:hypothetical protein WJX73_005644 [Symbiochloris irregularis]|uniref:BFN domain-containing protein n=1 Tax=Symbiochloris irregularis TaxID=706552 RepID=A0AAW1P392_9CHLO
MVHSQALLGAALPPVANHHARSGSLPLAPVLRRWGHSFAPLPALHPLSSCRRAQRTIARVSDHEYHAIPFNLEQDYVEAKVEAVQRDSDGHKVILRLVKDYSDGATLAMQVYIGEWEKCMIGQALREQQEAQIGGRPMTYDLFKSCMLSGEQEVSAVCVTDLRNSSYHARLVLTPQNQHDSPMKHAKFIDARPSDAINLALRFRSPIFVKKEIARKMARPLDTFPVPSHTDIEKVCRESLRRYPDPTLTQKLQLAVAVKEERYKDAVILRKAIEKAQIEDRALTLTVAIETALADKRFEEAARLREDFLHVLAENEAAKVQSNGLALGK